MKKYVLTIFALSSMIMCSSISVFAQQVKTPIFQQIQSPTEYILLYGQIQSLNYENNVLKSITLKDTKNNIAVYQINEETIFLDNTTKIKTDFSTLKKEDFIYLYHTMNTANTTPIFAEAIITNIAMDTSHAKLHTVEAIAINKNGTITITTEQGEINLTIKNDAIIKDYHTNNTLQISDIQIGQRFFTWYDTLLESYPAKAGIKQIVLLPLTKPVKQITYKEKNKVTYQKNTLPVVNGVTFVPLRETAAKLGLSITWDSKNRVTRLESNTRHMNLIEGNDYYISSTKIEGAVGMTAPIKLGAAPFIDKTNVMYVPAEAFHVLVGYDVIINDHTITIAQQNQK